MPALTIPGSVLVLYVGPTAVGFVTDFSYSQNLSVQQVEAFGDDLPQEIRAIGMTSTASFGHVCLDTQQLSTAGIVPRAVSGETVAYEPRDMMLVDNVSGAVRYRLTGCVPTTRGMTVGARTLAAENVTWACIAVLEGADA